MDAVVPERPVSGRIVVGILLLALLIPMVFHGCHAGGHDDDLLKIRIPVLRAG